MNINYVEEIRKLVTLKNGRISPTAKAYLQTFHTELFKKLINATNFLDADATITERLFCVENNITKPAVCVVCGERVKFQSAQKRYAETCSVACATKNPSTLEKRKQTNISKYGVVMPANGSSLTKKSMMQKYGVEKPLQLQKFQEKRKQTLIKKYGSDNCNEISEIIIKRKQTNNEKYGVDHSSQKNIVEQVKLLNDYNWLYEQHVYLKKSCVQIANEINVGVTTVNNAVNRFELLQTSNRSSYEHQLCAFLDELGVKYRTNDRTVISPKEIDILCYEDNIGIEICGHFWHSEKHGKKDRNYHEEKRVLCERKNIRLIQIFEYEWITKQDLVKNRLKHIFKKHDHPTTFARKCTIKQIDSRSAVQFLEKYHIQGGISSSLRFGAFYQNQLVGVMTFGKPRFSKKYQWELVRLAFSVPVIGGASKLFYHFVKQYNPQTIISYSDKRWNTGNVYKILNFEYRGASKPGYYYFHINSPQKMFHRVYFQKHKLEKLLSSFDPNLTEWENMQLNGYDRIWDCGNDCWLWEQNNG